MRIYGITGKKDSGKTTLVEKLVGEINDRGFSVSTIKHTHHKADVDQPGKDSFRHRKAGAREVLLCSQARWALMSELRGAPEPELRELLKKLSPVDVILVEGYKRDDHPKIEVIRSQTRTGKAPDTIDRTDPTIRAIATDHIFDCPGQITLDLNKPGQIADFVLDELGLSEICTSREKTGE